MMKLVSLISLFLLLLPLSHASLRKVREESTNYVKSFDNELEEDMKDDLQTNRHDEDETSVISHRREQTTTPMYFRFEVEVLPPDNLEWGWCLDADRVLLDQDMYRALTNYGLGQASADFQAVFSPNVCADRYAMLLAFRAMGFSWNGGIGCRSCSADNYDRKLRGLQTNPLLQPFATAFKNVLVTNVVPKHKNCLGTNPLVNVKVIEVTLAELNSCPSTNIPFLQTFSSYLPPCKSCNAIDFSHNGFNVNVATGTYVSTLWKAAYGFTVTASATTGGYYPSGQARVFNTLQPNLNGAKGQMDLGTPNELCGGVGRGAGGGPGQPGENCVPLGSK
jgi:hypothetical protein